jgi:N-acetylglutamate synthase
MPSVQPDWVGRRVVVRHQDPTGGPPYRDVVGELVALDTAAAVLLHAGDLRRVALDQIVAARLVAASAREILALEAVSAQGWRAAATTWRRGWFLRADHGFTSRANSALPLHPVDGPLTAALADAREWYTERNLPLIVSCPLPARRQLDRALAELGFTAGLDTLVLTGRIYDAGAADASVEIATAPSSEWLAAYRYRGHAGVPEAGRAILIRHERVAFAGARRHGALVGIARGAVDDGWLGVTAVEVDPRFRRTGVATELMAALTHWAASAHGATRGYLQVATTNGGAIALYARLGFHRHHVYRYRIDPNPPATPTIGS